MNEHAFHAFLNVFEEDSYFAQARDIFTRVLTSKFTVQRIRHSLS